METDALERVLRQMPTAMLVAEASDGRVVVCNDQVSAVWRRRVPTPESLEALAEWEGFHPDGRRYRVEEWPLARSLLLGESVEGEEIEIRRGDGTRGVVRFCSTPIRGPGGEVTSAVATFHDVTEQRALEAGRRLLAQASELLGSSLDYCATLRNVARLIVPSLADWCAVDLLLDEGRLERLAVEHVDPGKTATARELGVRYPPDLDAAHGVGRVLRTGEPELYPEIDAEMLAAAAHDQEHLALLRQLDPCSAMFVPLVARGRTLGVLVCALAGRDRRYQAADLELARDLALRAALAIDNARLHEESQSASQAKSDFLAVVSHELRTPLTAIIGYAELLELGIPEPVTERQRDQIERIEAAARHLQTLIEEILSVSTLEGGGARVRLEPVRFPQLLRRAEVIILPMALAKGLELRVHPPEDVLLETDPEKVLQVVLNLLSNAVKFTERGSISVRGTVREGVAEIAVEDTGIGISATDRIHIFDPFWQAEQPITRRTGGTGLGLTISRRIADLLGGEILVASEPRRGSTFLLRFPVGAS